MKISITRKIITTAMLSAIAFVLMLFEFPLPFLIPSFVKMDFSDLPALLGSFAYGPVCGVIIEFIKNILHIVIKGTTSVYIGEMFNFLCGSFLCLTAGIVYYIKRTRKGATIACIVGCLVMALISLPLNYFVVYPSYIKLYGLSISQIVELYENILKPISGFPTKNALFNCLLIFNLPFTFAKGFIDSVLCFIIYKPLSPILHKTNR